MQLTPSYGTDPVLALDGRPEAVVNPAVRQQRRLAEAVATFTDDQWTHPTRCDGWSAREVIVHLTDATSFWTASVTAGLAGEPTRFLAGFDPAATPPQLVAASDGLPTFEVADRYIEASTAFTDLVESLDGAGLAALAEAPPGHLRTSDLVHHALWDSWIHERDILLPMGATPTVEADEVAAGLRYAAGLTAAFAVLDGAEGRGAFAVDAGDPALSFVVEVDGRVRVVTGGGAAEVDLRLRGDAVELLEGLSLRRPLDLPVAPGAAWMLGGLATTFDATTG